MSGELDVAVVGGGLAGIAAALAARRLGSRVRVFEASDALGGKARTEGGLERGPHSFNGRHAVFWELLAALDLEGRATPLPAAARNRYLARGGRLHALTPSPLSLVATGALTGAEKLALVGDALGRRAAAPAASTVHDFFAARFGASFAEGPVAAMVSGIFAGDPRRLSMEGCFPELFAAAGTAGSVVRGMVKAGRAPAGRRGLFTLEGGLGAIGKAAQARLESELDCQVAGIERDRDGFWVHARRPVYARAVIVAAEAPAAARLLVSLSAPLSSTLAALEYVPLTVVHWEGELARFPPGFGYLACPQERLFALGTLFHPRGFSTFVRGVEQTDEALARGVESDVRALTSGRVGRVLRVDRHPHAVFQPTPEAVQARRALGAQATQAGVILAGSYLGASAMRDALTSGFRAGTLAHEAAQRMAA